MTALFFVIAIAVVGAFAAGTVANVRRGSALLRWVQGGLPLLGERTTLRWLGSSAVELVIKAAKPPFEQATVLVFLEPRDMPWMWAFARRRGRRDMLIVRGQLPAPPAHELEVLDPESWSGREALPRVDASWTHHAPAGRGELAIHCDGAAGERLATDLLGVARGAGLVVRRLSVRRNAPHLQLHLDPPASSSPASQLFEAIRALGLRAAGADRRSASVRS